MLPKEAKPYFNTATEVPVHESALVGFELEGKKYMARYSKKGNNYEFHGYFNKDNNKITRWEFSKLESFEVAESKLSILHF